MPSQEQFFVKWCRIREASFLRCWSPLFSLIPADLWFSVERSKNFFVPQFKLVLDWKLKCTVYVNDNWIFKKGILKGEYLLCKLTLFMRKKTTTELQNVRKGLKNMHCKKVLKVLKLQWLKYKHYWTKSFEKLDSTIFPKYWNLCSTKWSMAGLCLK